MTGRAVVLLLAVLVAACGRDQEPVIAPQDSTTTAPAVDGTAAPVDSAPGGEAVIPPSPVTSVAPATTVPDDGIVATGPPGSFARGVLRPGRGNRIVVEVSVQAGAEPRAETLEHVTSVLASVSQKDVFLASGGTPPVDDAWTGDELRAAVDAVATTPQSDDAAVLRLLFVHGSFAESDDVLGVAVRGDAAALFVDDIRAASTPLVGSASIEVATTTHEVGHLLGLVDLVLDTGREDPAHPTHSRNRASVMYWAVESSLVGDLLSGGPPRNFDDDDLADLAQLRST